MLQRKGVLTQRQQTQYPTSESSRRNSDSAARCRMSPTARNSIFVTGLVLLLTRCAVAVSWSARWSISHPRQPDCGRPFYNHFLSIPAPRRPHAAPLSSRFPVQCEPCGMFMREGARGSPAASVTFLFSRSPRAHASGRAPNIRVPTQHFWGSGKLLLRSGTHITHCARVGLLVRVCSRCSSNMSLLFDSVQSGSPSVPDDGRQCRCHLQVSSTGVYCGAERVLVHHWTA